MKPGPEALFAGIEQQPVVVSQDPGHPKNKNGRATDSCFFLIGAQQCGTLMKMVGQLTAYNSIKSETLVIQLKLKLSTYVASLKVCNFNPTHAASYMRHSETNHTAT